VNKIGARIYFDKITGNVLVSKGEMQGYVIESTVEQDIISYTVLSERNRSTFDYIQLAFGEYAQDFSECIGFRVNPLTKEIEFSYPDSNAPELPQEPVIFQKPLTEQVREIESRLNLVQQAMDEMLLGGF
jgi:hypothetical protein